jgi:hypothetical protein
MADQRLGGRVLVKQRWLMAIAAGTFVLGCQDKAAPPPASASASASCEAHVPHWIERIKAAPEVTQPARARADLPVASLGGVVGDGKWVEVREHAVLLDGQTLPGKTDPEQLRALTDQLSAGWGANGLPSAAEKKEPLYLSVGATTDVRALRAILEAIPTSFAVQLVFQTPAADASKAGSELTKLPYEADPAARSRLARSAYAQATRCAPLLDALAAVPERDPHERWKGLRAALLDQLPHCDCRDTDPVVMRDLLLVERRGGAVALGSLPLDFMREERCGASLGLTPLQDVVTDIQTFDEKFSASQQGEEMVFEPVVTNAQLGEYICQALPGETLAALQRERRTFYWRVPGVAGCQAWQFEPRQPGSPMGTWRYRAPSGQAALAIHYVQGAEEIRLSGPVTDGQAAAGEDQQWDCTQDFSLRGVDGSSIELEEGRWYFDANACEAASPGAAEFPGCISALASQANGVASKAGQER